MSLIPCQLLLPSGENLNQVVYLPDVPFPGDTVAILNGLERIETTVIRRTFLDAGEKVFANQEANEDLVWIELEVRLRKI